VQPFEINPKIIQLLRMGHTISALTWTAQIQVLGGANKTMTHTFCNLSSILLQQKDKQPLSGKQMHRVPAQPWFHAIHSLVSEKLITCG
jgi:hypothetical protein